MSFFRIIWRFFYAVHFLDQSAVTHFKLIKLYRTKAGFVPYKFFPHSMVLLRMFWSHGIFVPAWPQRKNFYRLVSKYYHLFSIPFKSHTILSSVFKNLANFLHTRTWSTNDAEQQKFILYLTSSIWIFLKIYLSDGCTEFFWMCKLS